MNELEKQIQVVAMARQTEEQLKILKVESYAKWLDDNALLVADIITAEKLKLTEESRLRELVLIIFKETGEKKPAPEVGIREVEKLTYDNNLAMYWAKEHSLALKLDTAAFENIVKASPVDFASFVKIEKVPTATIATKIEIKQEGV